MYLPELIMPEIKKIPAILVAQAAHHSPNLMLWNAIFCICLALTLSLLTTTIIAPPSNASKWQMGFNSAFKGLLIDQYQVPWFWRMIFSKSQVTSVKWLFVNRHHHFTQNLFKNLNHLTPNDHFSGRTAPLTYSCCMFYSFNRYTYWILMFAIPVV